MPNTEMSLPEQVIYKLGELSSKVETGFKNLEDRMDFFNGESEKLEQRICDIEKWQNTVTTRFATIGAGAAIVWTFVSPYIQSLVGIHK